MEEENSCLFVPEIYKYSTKFVRIASPACYAMDGACWLLSFIGQLSSSVITNLRIQRLECE